MATLAGLQPGVSIEMGMLDEGLQTTPANDLAAGIPKGPDDQSPLNALTTGNRASAVRPIYFEPNLGQYDAAVVFATKADGYTFFLTQEEAVFVFTQSDHFSTKEASAASGLFEEPVQQLRQGQAPRTHVVRMEFVDAAPAPEITGTDEQPGRSNYFRGNEPSAWTPDVPHYANVVVQDLWPGIDAVFYATAERSIQYDFLVQPGADPEQIRLAFDGARPVRDDQGGLRFSAQGTTPMEQSPPYSYQETDHGVREVPSGFQILGDDRVGFEVGPYDPERTLVIDPIVYSTYLGGSGADAAFDIAVDEAGSAYVVGETLSHDFPMKDAYQDEQLGRVDVFLTKFTPAGDALVYSTYLGGSAGFGAGDSIGRAVDVDDEGHAYLTANTVADDYPTTPGVFQTWGGGLIDPVVTKLAPQGNALVFSTFVASPTIDWVLDLAVDDEGHAHITGGTPSEDYPSTPGAFQPEKGGNWDAYVVKLEPDASALVYGTFLGGDRNDRGQGIAIGPDGAAYATGWTTSTDFPMHEAFQSSHAGGGFDAYVTKLTPEGDQLGFSTYLGGTGDDRGQAIVIAPDGSVLLTGIAGPGFPLHNPLQPLKGSLMGSDAFAARFIPDGDGLAYSTYLGGSYVDHAWAIDLDEQGNAVIAGETQSPDFPTTVRSAQPYKSGALGGDAFVTTVSPMGEELLYSTYLGGMDGEVAYGVAVDPAGDRYTAGLTMSLNFPTRDAYQPMKSTGLRDVFVTKLTDPAMVPEICVPGDVLCIGTPEGGNEQLDGGSAVDCLPHPPVSITQEHGPEGFTWTDPVSGETKPRPGSGVTRGSGSEQDPYVIEGWCIVNPPSAGIDAGIEIAGTDAHVVVQDNILLGAAGAGVRGAEVSNLEIKTNTIRGHGTGVVLAGATENVVRDNTIIDNNGNGVFLSLGSQQNIVEANTIERSTSHGVSISGTSNNNVVRGNTMVDNRFDGLFVGGSRDNLAIGNTISGNRDGVSLSVGGHRTTLQDNTIHDNHKNGVYARFSNNHLLEGNAVHNNTEDGVFLSGSSRIMVRDNTVSDNGRNGVRLEGSSNNGNVETNTLRDNGWDGVRLEGSSLNAGITDNSITGNRDGVFIGFASENAVVNGNNIHGNGRGLFARDLGSPVDAIGNWWGHESGPSGGLEDACTTSIVDGEGDEVAAGSAEVCFEPWRDEANAGAGAQSGG